MPTNPPRRLTDPVQEWETAYVNHKLKKPPKNKLQKLLFAGELYLDKWIHPRGINKTSELLDCIDLLVDTESIGKSVAVIGCGPAPASLLSLADLGFDVSGIEPVESAVEAANTYLGGAAKVVQGTAEHIPFASGSQSLVLLENVLEHVDSVRLSLAECYRVLKPGGVLYVRTTNRQRFSFTGINWEYRTRFFNWFPSLVKESYVFSQLHYKPEMAYYSPRPAVHWFSFSDLCMSGRDVGFAKFYSPFDLFYLTEKCDKSKLCFRLRHWTRRSPWIRALLISQMNGDILMWKRPDETV